MDVMQGVAEDLKLVRSQGVRSSDSKLPARTDTLAAYVGPSGFTVNVFDLNGFLAEHGVNKCHHLNTVVAPKQGVCQAYHEFLKADIGSEIIRKQMGKSKCLLTPELMKAILNAPCAHKGCNSKGENWMCLCCLKVYCGRYANKHMLQHHKDSGHCITISLNDFSIWCYACDDYLEQDFFPTLQKFFTALHEAKFGKPPPQKWVDMEKSKGLKRAMSWQMGPASKYSVLSMKDDADSKKITTERRMVFPGTFAEPCPHLKNIASKPPAIPIPTDALCQHPDCGCAGKGDNWICLEEGCMKVFCGRNKCKHMLKHSEETAHEVALSLNDLSTWCYRCQAFLDHSGNSQLLSIFEYFHRLKFGDAPPKPSLTCIPALSRSTSANSLAGGSLDASDFDSSMFSWDGGDTNRSLWTDFPSAELMDSPVASPRKRFPKEEDSSDCGCGGDSDSSDDEQPKQPANKKQKV